MQLLLATNHLGLGGSESYLLTVAEQLDRLGHEVALFSLESGDGATVASEKGIRLIDQSDLSDDFDAVLVQDGAVSYQVAAGCPTVPQVFVAHSEIFDLQAPPQLDGMVAQLVAVNDRVADRLRSYANEVDVIRLKQPIDTERFMPRGTLPETPRRALLLSNTPNSDRVPLLERLCAEAGLELTRVGGLAGHATDIQPALAAADIVIGYGRSILEAMACGRAAYVYDWKGGDGWVTANSYAAIEADGIAGGGNDAIIDPDRLAEDLRMYHPSMGPVNRDLVVAHHRANVHVQDLLKLFKRIAQPRDRPQAPMQEMARLVRIEWRSRLDIGGLRHENAHLRRLLTESERRGEETRAELAAKQRQAENETARRYQSTLSWRLTRPVRALGELLRRRRSSLVD